MKVVIAENPGFCYGVERAYALAKENKNKGVFMLGELIHNPQVIAELEKDGIRVVQNLEKLPTESSVIIRAHGVSNQTRKQLKEKKIKILDGSCPFVIKAHLLAQNFIKSNLQLVIIGNPQHPEIKGIYEDFPTAWIVQKAADIEFLPIKKTTKIGVICQTTLKLNEVKQLVSVLKQKTDFIDFQNTICSATSSKQISAKEVANKVNLMIVVGGKNSNNTLSLYTLCQEICPTYLITAPEEIKPEWFKQIKTVGLTGGASTPMELIEKVKIEIEKLG